MELLILSISASTRSSVGRLLPPRVMSTMPSTMSGWLSWPTMPRRGAFDTRTSATSRTSTGVPLTRLIIVSRMSSMSRIRPMPRTTADCCPTFSVWPPTLIEALFSALVSCTRGQALGLEAVQVDRDLVLLGLAAEGRDVDDAGDRLEPALQHPVLQGLHVHGRVAGRADELVAHDLAHRARRRDLRRGAVGQRRGLRQAVEDPLQRLLVRVLVVELDLHVREAEQRDRPDHLGVRDAGERHLQGNGDVALDLVGRLARVLGDHVDERRDRIRVGLDVELRVGAVADAEHHDEQQHHQHALAQREGDQGVHRTGSPLRTPCRRWPPGR